MTPNQYTAWEAILSVIGQSKFPITEIGNLFKTCRFFHKYFPTQIYALWKCLPVMILPISLTKFVHLRRVYGITVLLTSLDQLDQLPSKLKICDFRIRDRVDLLVPSLLKKEFKYLTVRIDPLGINIVNRNGIWYANEQHRNLFPFENNIVWIDNGITPEYLQLCRSSRPAIINIKAEESGHLSALSLNYNYNLCNLDSRLCQLFKIPSGPHQYCVCDLAMYLFCQEHPPETWNPIEQALVEDNFQWNGHRFSLKLMTFGDLRIYNIKKLVKKDAQIYESMLEKINIDDYIRNFDPL